jgi:integrase
LIVNLKEAIAGGLKCSPGKSSEEICDGGGGPGCVPGLYISVSAANPGQGTYYVRYKDKNGKTCHQKLGRTCVLDVAAARQKAKALKAEIAANAYDPRAVAKAQKEVLTFSDFFQKHYLPHAKSHKRSWPRDEELFRLRIQAEFGNKRLNQITRHQIQSFHTSVLDTGLSPASADHHVKLLKHALNLAIDWGMLTEKNPAIRVPLFNAPNQVEHYLDDDQLENLLTVLRTDENRTVCLIALFLLSTGCRLNEALSAQWAQVDKENRVWRITANDSKSKKMRSIPLNDSAIDVLGQLDTEGQFDHLFVNRTYRKENENYGKPYTTIMKVWSRLRTKAGLPHLRLHDLRHQYASFLVNSGRTLYEVQQILGHSDPKVTMRYSHLSSKSLQAAANSASVMIKAASQGPTEDAAA